MQIIRTHGLFFLFSYRENNMHKTFYAIFAVDYITSPTDMAKSKTASNRKKKSNQQTAHLSPAEWLRTKARTLPIGKCYVGTRKEKPAMRHTIVTRVRPSGNIAAAHFLIDTACFGITDSFCLVNLTPEEWEETLADWMEDADMVETPYNEVHNLIYGALEFGEETGLGEPDSFALNEFMLEEDTDDIPLIPFDFGRNGKHYLEISKLNSDALVIASKLHEKLGDNFEFNITDPDRQPSRKKQYPSEPFSYDYPVYPTTLNVKHPEIADAFLSPDNLYNLPQEIKDLILSLPPEEAAADIASILLYTIGNTYRDITENPDEAISDGAILHSLIFLSAINSDKALGALIELLHQSDDFMEAHLGDFATSALPHALATALGTNPEQIIPLLDTPGLASFNRFYILKALAIMADKQPEMRQRIITLMSRHLQRLTADLPAVRACDPEYAGLIMPLFTDLKATELQPEIKSVYDTGQVDISICGPYDELFEDSNYPPLEIATFTIDQYYDQLERSCKNSLDLL